MAVYAAHLTRTVSGEPSVFQVAAQEALGNTVKPALRKLVEYLAAVYPNKCGWTVDWYDELYLVFDCCLQYHYLKHYAASFSESFYGLVRTPVRAGAGAAAGVGGEFGDFSSGVRLAAHLERGSLALLVLLPYLRDRAAALAERWRQRHEDGQLGKSTPDRLRRAAVTLYSVVHTACACAQLYQTAAFVCGRSRSATAPLALLRLALAEAPPPDEPDYSWGDLLRSVLTGRLGSAAVTFPMLGALALRGVEYGAFFVQLLRWWESRAPAPAHAALPVPPPPPQSPEPPARLRNRCPICLGAWRVPTALPASGLVYCYGCISRELRARRRCPATGLPAAEHQLVRIYVDH